MMISKPPLASKKVILPRVQSSLGRQGRAISATRSKSNSRPNSGFRSSSNSKNMPTISAQGMCVVECSTGRQLCGFNDKRKMQIASITKLMTLYVSLKLLQDLRIDFHSKFYVTEEAANIGGTSAGLKLYDEIQVIDLFYALMLPSGNDAGLVLAENLSYLITEQVSALSISYRVQPFVDKMNQYALQLEMFNTRYYNPHGMHNDASYSTAADVTKLCLAAIQIPQILEVIKQQSYSCQIRRNNQITSMNWNNTNKLLSVPGFIGIKTGQTNRAGPCLASYYKKDQFEFIIVILNCLTPELRWEETLNLVRWASTQE